MLSVAEVRNFMIYLPLMAALTQSSEKLWWQIALILGFVAMAIFANTIPNDYALDDELVTRNHPLTSQGIKAIPQIFTSYYYDNAIGNYYEYRPVVLASFALEHSLFGDNPHVGHAINVLLYGITCVVLFFVIRSFQPEKNWLLPAVATLLFAAHPLHTEVVASIKNRDELFSFLFGISALLWALKYARSGRWQQYALFVLFILLSVVSKRSVLSYAFIVPLAASWFSSAGLVRILSLSFPLLLIVAFFSPIHEPQTNALLLGGIFVFPVLLWGIKAWHTGGWPTVANDIKKHLLQGSEATVSSKTTLAKGNLHKWGIAAVVLTLGFLAAASLLFLYLDLRALMYLSLMLVAIGTFLLPRQQQGYAILASLLALGLMASNFGAVAVLLVAIALLVSMVTLVPAHRHMRIGAGLCVAIIMLAHLYIKQGHVEALTHLLLVAALLVAHPFLKFKWIVPMVFAIIAAVKLAQLHPAGLAHIFCAVLTFYHSKKDIGFRFFPIATLLGVAVLFAFTTLLNYPPNQIYHQHLGAYYAQLPDPYGDGAKTVTDIVPGAGREVDFVENPLVAEKRLSVKIATAGKVMAYYTGLMIIPLHLRYYYGFDQISIASFADPLALLGWIGYIVLFLLALWLYKHDRLVSFALLYLLLGLLFVSNLGVLLTGIVAERLVYGASLGFCLLAAAGLLRLFKVSETAPVRFKQLKPAFGLVVVILFGLYAGRSVARNMDWKNALTLYTHDARTSPRSAKVQQLAGYQYIAMAAQNPAKQNEYLPLAEKYLKNALAIAPKFHTAMYNLGYVYTLKQDCANAIVYYERFIAVSPAPPELTLQYALCLDVQGRLPEAAQQYEKFLSVDAYFLPAYANLGYIYFRQGNYQKAIDVNKRAIDLMPNEADPYINMGKTYLQLNLSKEAIPFFERAQQISPNDINLLLTLSDLHRQVGDPNHGQTYYNRALQLGYRPQ